MELLYELFKNLILTYELLMIPLQGNVSFNDNGVRAPNMQRVYQFRNIIYGEPKSSLTRSIINNYHQYYADNIIII